MKKLKIARGHLARKATVVFKHKCTKRLQTRGAVEASWRAQS